MNGGSLSLMAFFGNPCVANTLSRQEMVGVAAVLRVRPSITISSKFPFGNGPKSPCKLCPKHVVEFLQS